MKKALLVMTVASFLCLVGGGSALAAFQQVTLELTGVGNDRADWGVYAGPYQFTVTTSNNVITTEVPLNCDTYVNEIYEQESWTANVVPGNEVTGNTLFNSGFYEGATTQVAYDEMFWLVEQMNSIPNTTPAGLTTIEDIQYAIWTIADPNQTPPYTTDGNAATWLAAATNPSNYDTVDAADFLVYVPKAGTQPGGDGMPQEFIQQVPEPNSLIFLGFSLLMVAGAVTLKVRKAHA